MFNNREFRVRIAKQDDQSLLPVERKSILTQDEIQIVKELGRNIALFVGGVYLAGKLIDAGSDIIVHTTSKPSNH